MPLPRKKSHSELVGEELASRKGDYLKIAMAILRNRDEAEDAVSRTFIKMIRGGAVQNIVPYIKQSVRNMSKQIISERKNNVALDGYDFPAQECQDAGVFCSFIRDRIKSYKNKTGRPLAKNTIKAVEKILAGECEARGKLGRKTEREYGSIKRAKKAIARVLNGI